jgi:FHA domain/zinc-ribbon domain
VDQGQQPPVAWSPESDASRYDARTDVYSIGAARPANGRLGDQMGAGGSGPGTGGLSGKICPACGAQNTDNARFCSQCATPLTREAADRGSFGETTSMIFAGVEPPEAEPFDPSAVDAAAVDTLPPNTALLVVRRGPNEGSRFLLDSELTEVGRQSGSDIFLDDVTVSRRHAEFYRQGARFTVRDVGSLNGTYVNRERIEEVALNGGDEVQIGKFRMVFLQGRLSHAETAV